MGGLEKTAPGLSMAEISEFLRNLNFFLQSTPEFFKIHPV